MFQQPAVNGHIHVELPKVNGGLPKSTNGHATSDQVKPTPKRAPRKRTARRPARRYRLPALLGIAVDQRGTEIHCRSAIRAAWCGGKNVSHASTVKAAREDIARWPRTPSEIEAMVRCLINYVDRPYPSEAECKQTVEWLIAGDGCTKRTIAQQWCRLAYAVRIDGTTGWMIGSVDLGY